MTPADALDTKLRAAARQPECTWHRTPDAARGFAAFIGGASARVQIDHIDGQLCGGLTVTLRHLTPEAAEAVLHFLSTRNQPNGTA